MAILEVNDISKNFGSTTVLHKVSFSLEEGKRSGDHRLFGIR